MTQPRRRPRPPEPPPGLFDPPPQKPPLFPENVLGALLPLMERILANTARAERHDTEGNGHE